MEFGFFDNALMILFLAIPVGALVWLLITMGIMAIEFL